MGGFFGWLGSCILLCIAIGGLIECCSRFSRREVHVFYHKDEEETPSLSQVEREQKICKSDILPNGVTL